MEQNFQTSFIPKKPIIKEREASSSRPVSIFLIIALLVLFTLVLASGGLYFYKGLVAKDIVKMQTSLNLAKARFEPARIAELQLLDKRLRASSEILSKHTTVSPIFAALEELTMKSVRFTQFSYAAETEKNTTLLKVKMSGQAIGYRSIALQSDLFTTKEIGKNFIDPVFSNLTLDNSGNVLFDLDFSVDPSFLNYKKVVSASE